MTAPFPILYLGVYIVTKIKLWLSYCQVFTFDYSLTDKYVEKKKKLWTECEYKL